MNQQKAKRLFATLLALVLLVSCLTMPSVAASKEQTPETDAAIQAVNTGRDGVSYQTVDDPQLPTQDQDVTILVRLEEQTPYARSGDLQIAAAGTHNQLAALAQAESQVAAILRSDIQVEHRYTLLFNGFSFTGKAWMVDAINELEGISAFVAPVFSLVEPEATEKDVNLAPSTSVSAGTVGAMAAWDLGYTGEGTLIGIIDSGIRRTHEAFSVMPENGKVNRAYLAKVYAQYNGKIHAGTLQDIDEIFYSEKLPFNWDYIDGDANPNHTYTDHGTHVAGIAAGNNGRDFQGIAPDAQIATFQVFDSQGGASFDTLMLALEDCVYLGVDAVNMSLGLPAWYTAYESLSATLGDIYATLENAGISVAVAAGNDQYSSLATNYGDYNSYENAWLALNMDNGITGAPATFTGSFGVGSALNVDTNDGCYLVAYGKEYWPTATDSFDAPFMGQMPEGEYDLVYAGSGSMEEFEALGNLEGKIAIVIANSLMDLWNNCENAMYAGAAGYIACYDYFSGMYSPIPFAMLTKAQGQEIVANFPDGVNGKITIKHGFDYSAITMATSSSWGTTADLRIAPEITAPGEYINSSVGAEWYDDATYEGWSGTSMATPHVAAGLAILKQRLREEFPGATPREINDLAYAVLMSTANPINAFVRQQGAGLMDLEAALTTDTYITVPGANRPKLEVGESEDGTFTMVFQVNNFGETSRSYQISTRILTEQTFDLAYSGNTTVDKAWAEETGFRIANPETVTVKALNGRIKDVTDLCQVSGPNSITVPAGESVTVELTISCGRELMDYFAENCEAGMYLEGWIRLEDQTETDRHLSVPFLGFVGDWDYAPMFDQGFWWNLPYGQNNMSQMETAAGTYIGSGILDQGLGLNPYWDATGKTYVADRNAFSPNGDGLLDNVNYMEFNLMRNAKNLKVYVVDVEGNVLQTIEDADYTYRKEYYQTMVGVYYTSLRFDFTGEELEENETVYFVVEAYLDHEGYDIEKNYNGRMVFPVTKDLTAPAIRVVDGGVEIVDANYTAYYAVYADPDKTQLLYETGVFADQRGMAERYDTDLTTFYVATADYARNEAFYEVSDGMVIQLEGGLTEGSDMLVRTYINWTDNVYQYGFAKMNSATPNLVEPLHQPSSEKVCSGNPFGIDLRSGAVNYDGNVILLGEDRHLWFMDSETYEVTQGPLLTYDGRYISNIRGISIHPETYEVHLMYKSGSSHWFGKVDTETGVFTRLWKMPDGWEWDPSYGSWAFTFLDANTVALFSHSGHLYVMNYADGSAVEEIDMRLQDNVRSYAGNTGVADTCGNMIFDAETNCLYIFSNWNYFRNYRYGDHGYIAYDLDTRTISLHNTGAVGGILLKGICFMDDIKPADFYACQQLIAAIGEVTLDSKEAIQAARAAYEALDDYGKSRVENYTDLLRAEHAFAILQAEESRLVAARAYALLTLLELEEDLTDPKQLQALSDAREAILNAASVEEIEAILAELDLTLAVVSFRDVSVNDWYYDSVLYVMGKGLMQGIGDGLFAPNANLTRAELVTVLYRLAGEPSVEGLENPFADVTAGQWYTDAVIWAVNAGITTGTSGTTFAPAAMVTREQIATFLYRYAGSETVEEIALGAFTDADSISAYAVDAMNWAVAGGLIQGMGDGTLDPQGSATRAQIATVLMRYCEN